MVVFIHQSFPCNYIRILAQTLHKSVKIINFCMQNVLSGCVVDFKIKSPVSYKLFKTSFLLYEGRLKSFRPNQKSKISVKLK